MSEAEFANAFVLAQVVPGPNILVVSLIGWHVAGVPGALLAVVAMCGPSSVLALAVARALRSPRAARWRYRIQTGLGPLTIGLMLSSGLVLGAERRPLRGRDWHDGGDRADPAPQQRPSAAAHGRGRGPWPGGAGLIRIS